MVARALAIAALSILSLPAVAMGAPGDLDRSFGDGGIVTHDFGRETTLNAVATQDDGRVVVAGSTLRKDAGVHRSRVLVARFRANGSLDRSFADRGKRIVDLPGRNDTARGIVLTPRGRIAVGVGTGDADHYGDEYYTAGVLQLDPDGSLDRRFGDKGIAFTSGGIPSDLARADDGDLVLATSYAEDENCCTTALARMKADGARDKRFSNDGFKKVSGSDPLYSAAGRAGLALDGNRAYVVGSYFSGTVNAVAFNERGEPVDGFSDGNGGCRGAGVACYDYPGTTPNAVSAAIDARHRLTIGVSFDGEQASALRLLRSGELDTTYGEDGLSAGSPGAGSYFATEVLIDAGRTILTGGGPAAFTRAIDASGTTDSTWGSDGYTQTLAGRDPRVNASARGADTIVAAGAIEPRGSDRVRALLIRYRD